MATAERNARFWVWHREGWVKLTIRPGGVLNIVTGGPHDEGWTRTDTGYQHEGGGVRMDWVTEGRDCDGYHTAGGSAVCPLDRLASDIAGDTEAGDLVAVPAWEDVDRYQRDHTAEAAGY